MTTFIRVLATVVALAFSATLALAHDYKLGNLDIKHPWAKATLPGQPVAGGFMKITNNGSEPDRLLKVTSGVSNMIQVHEMKVEDGVMKMGELPDGLEIAPGATVELKPGGLHVMFMGIKAPFKEGESVKATLTFEKAGTIEVEFKVDAAKPGDDAHKHHQTQ
jgi:periplasmic copper chaperone A